MAAERHRHDINDRAWEKIRRYAIGEKGTRSKYIWKKIFSAIIVVAAFIALASILPPLLILIPTVPAIFIWFIVGIGLHRKKKTSAESDVENPIGPSSTPPSSTENDSEEDRTVGIYMKYLAVLLVCFIVVPLVVIIAAMILQYGWNQFPLHDRTNMAAWLEFFRVASETAENLLELLR